MRFKTIGYGRAISRHYNSDKVYAQVEIEEWEDPTQALNHLKHWVNQQVEEREIVERLEDKKEHLERQLCDYNWRLTEASAQWKRIHERWQKAIDFLKLHGVTPDAVFPTPPDFIRYEDLKSDCDNKEGEDEDEDDDDDEEEEDDDDEEEDEEY